MYLTNEQALSLGLYGRNLRSAINPLPCGVVGVIFKPELERLIMVAQDVLITRGVFQREYHPCWQEEAPRTLEMMTRDRLDAIATAAGCVLCALNNIDDKDLIPGFRKDLRWLEREACEEMMRRGYLEDFS